MDRAGWDERYAAAELVWSAEPNRFVAEVASALEPGAALDLACGEGRNAIWLAEQGWRATGVDFSEVALAKAARLAEARHVEVTWVPADVVTYEPDPGAFDLVVLAYLHLPGGPLAGVVARALAALAPGGRLLVVGHARSNLDGGYGGPQDPAVLYEPDDVVAALAGVEVERAEHVTRQVATPGGERTAVDTLVLARRPLTNG